MLHRLLANLLALSSFAALRAAETPALSRVTSYADWFPGAQFAGIYVAIGRGYYRDIGLDATLVPVAYDQKTTARLDAQPETCGVATSESYIFLQKRAAGADLKALGDDLAQLTRGELGAMRGFVTEEFVKLRRLVGDEARFPSFAELGFDSYFQLIYTTAPQLPRHRETLRRFLAAIRLHRDPKTTDESFHRACLIALRNCITPDHSDALAPADAAKLTRLRETCVDIGLFKTAEPVANFIVDLGKP